MLGRTRCSCRCPVTRPCLQPWQPLARCLAAQAVGLGAVHMARQPIHPPPLPLLNQDTKGRGRARWTTAAAWAVGPGRTGSNGSAPVEVGVRGDPSCPLACRLPCPCLASGLVPWDPSPQATGGTVFHPHTGITLPLMMRMDMPITATAVVGMGPGQVLVPVHLMGLCIGGEGRPPPGPRLPQAHPPHSPPLAQGTGVVLHPPGEVLLATPVRTRVAASSVPVVVVEVTMTAAASMTAASRSTRRRGMNTLSMMGDNAGAFP
jgi:hypothetical protein